MKVRVLRRETGDQGTFSDVSVEDETGRVVFRSKGGELPWRGNKTDISCDPAGTYPLNFRWSQSHGRKVWHIDAVPDRTECEIHSGNLCGDEAKGYPTDVKGCLILGEEIVLFEPGQQVGTHLVINPQHGVTRSRDTVAAFEKVMGEKPASIVVEWAPGVSPEIS